MTLANGTKLGRYEIRLQLGAGGMGEVYLARDTKLGRDVAVKVLRSNLVRDTQLRQRMEREAHAVSSLNHPHICALYDVGHQDGTDFLVMEYLEGETLADRLLRGPLPVEQVLRYGVEIVDALDKAHRQGIVHRDLKPGNIMLTKSGTKLLDFGLAKLQPPKLEAGVLSELPTEHLNITAEGTIPGTLQYMAPEQLEGGQVDARSDIFAFGTVLYEMATGHKAFDGKSPASLIASIMNTDPPPVSTLQPMTPPAFDRVVRTCLAKDPDERFQTAHDVGLQMKWIVEGGSQAGVPAPVVVRRKIRDRVLVAAALVFFIATVALAILYFRSPHAETTRAVRFQIAPTERETFADGTISPDGRRLVINVWDSSGMSLLWVRALDSFNAQPLPGTESAGSITNFWSPDSHFIGFFSGAKLKKVEATGGPPQTICDAPNGFGGTWNRDGVILFAPENSTGLYRVSASGGAPAPVTSLDESRQEISHRWPVFLPDGKHFLYLAQSSRSENTGIFVGALDSKETKRLLSTITAAAYASPGYLLFMRERTLMAQPFDANKVEFTGEAFPLVEQLNRNIVLGVASFSVSESGVLTYVNFNELSGRLEWFDRTGKLLGTIGSPGRYVNFSLSRDDRWVAAARADSQLGTRDIWLIDLARGTPLRFTFSPADDWLPVWSPDGNRIVFTSDQDGPGNLYQKPSSGAVNDEQILKTSERKWPSDWSADGRFIAYASASPKTRLDLWVLPMEGERKPVPYLQTPFNEDHAKFSPNGRFIAYSSDESGRYEVYVQTLPASGSKWQISTGGGAQPRWRRDGRELFYISPERKVMAVDIKADSSTFEIGTPKALFQTRLADYPGPRNDYDVSADGQRFLINNLPEEVTSTPISVVINWTSDLKH